MATKDAERINFITELFFGFGKLEFQNYFGLTQQKSELLIFILFLDRLV